MNCYLFLFLAFFSDYVYSSNSHKAVNLFGCQVSYPELPWQEHLSDNGKPHVVRLHNLNAKTHKTPRRLDSAEASIKMYDKEESAEFFFYERNPRSRIGYFIGSVNLNPERPYIKKNYAPKEIDRIKKASTKGWFINVVLRENKKKCEILHEEWDHDEESDVITGTVFCKQVTGLTWVNVIGYYRSINSNIIRVDNYWMKSANQRFDLSDEETWPVTRAKIEEVKRRFKTIQVNCHN